MTTLLSFLATIFLISSPVGKTTLCKNDTINITQDFTTKQFENDVLEHQQLKDNEIELYNNHIRNKYLMNVIVTYNFLFFYLVFNNQMLRDNIANVRFLL
ncbi:hypothetical protein [Spiroplasma phoeniceum]|uniref:Spiroplasma plectrovirus-related protein n=1 Tax=Spiroplasma phoeniceum P40 TaxID=1276259 RepID=A0A345DSM9_9MOLU|nr:hypothetical protein [Spiroplasma phoeniceum]AXF97220.1 hypothetical protein SDAV_003023 [Spiroplasma phoeniceum P40]